MDSALNKAQNTDLRPEPTSCFESGSKMEYSCVLYTVGIVMKIQYHKHLHFKSPSLLTANSDSVAT